MMTSTKHVCELPKERAYLLRPCASKREKFFAKLRELCTIWENHYRTKTFFRSIYSYRQEKRRHLILSRNWYIIHPLSQLCFYRNWFFITLWTFTLFFDCFQCAFINKTYDKNERHVYDIIVIIIDGLLMVNCIMTFFCGYINYRTQEIVLKPATIALKYLKTYLIFDILACMPIDYIYQLINDIDLYDQYYNKTYLDHLIRWYRIIRIPRIITITNYSYLFVRNKTENLTLSATIIFVFITIYLIHTYTCILYYVIVVNDVKHVRDFLDQLRETNRSSWSRYLTTLYITFVLFANCGYELSFQSVGETTLSITIAMSGLFIKIVTIAFLYVALISKEAGAIKYETLINEIRGYAKIKRLRPALKRRLLYYYQRVFLGEFYDVHTIQETLSYNLHRKLYYKECMHIMQTAVALNGATLNFAEKILINSEKEYYLPGDVIHKCGNRLNSLLLVMYGSIAVLLPQGHEFNEHFCDGEIMGETTYITRGPLNVSIIAVEFTEILKIPLHIVDELCKENGTFKEVVVVRGKQKYYTLLRSIRKSKRLEQGLEDLPLEGKRLRSFLDLNF